MTPVIQLLIETTSVGSHGISGKSLEEPSLFADTAQTLSARLRAETSAAHLQVEWQVRLPESIKDIDDYRKYLALFYQLYRPLEARLGMFEEWQTHGFYLEELGQTPRLASDLSALGIMPILMRDAPPEKLPSLSNFSHAVGALYVLEGSTLGSQIILRHLEQVVRIQLAGATAYLRGHGEATGECWKQFKRTLDRYGENRPSQVEQIIEGANDTFRSIGEWMKFDQQR